MLRRGDKVLCKSLDQVSAAQWAVRTCTQPFHAWLALPNGPHVSARESVRSGPVVK